MELFEPTVLRSNEPNREIEMPRKFEFKNDNGETLSGALEEPTAELRRGVALFAHCFSCGKKVLAASRVSRGLRERGFTVLRFDFTGLGESEGEFADTNFSTNVDDLRAAINAMRQEGMAPDILIGHSPVSYTHLTLPTTPYV